MRIVIVTYNRLRMLKRLVKQLPEDADIDIINDGGRKPEYENATVHNLPHYGREEFWRLWLYITRHLKRRYWNECLLLPDDVTLVDGAIETALETFRAIEDPNKVALNILVDHRGHGLQWVPKDPDKRGDVWLTRWIDGCGLVNRRFFEELNWQIGEVPPNHFVVNQSSGVWSQVSKRLYSKGMNIYQVDETLVRHGDHASRMHKEHRREVPL